MTAGTAFNSPAGKSPASNGQTKWEGTAAKQRAKLAPAQGASGRTIGDEMSTPVPKPIPSESLELPVDELDSRARPLPPYDEMVIDDLTPEEAEAFLAARRRS